MDITEICMECKNFFLKEREKSIHSGEYTISDGEISNVDFLKKGQYFNIHGSDLNDGVYLYTGEKIDSLKDESFSGSVWAMSVPPSFLKLCEDISAWKSLNENADSRNMSPFQSESVTGVYSYTKSGNSGSRSSGSSVMTWQDVFKTRLDIWRKISIL